MRVIPPYYHRELQLRFMPKAYDYINTLICDASSRREPPPAMPISQPTVARQILAEMIRKLSSRKTYQSFRCTITSSMSGAIEYRYCRRILRRRRSRAPRRPFAQRAGPCPLKAAVGGRRGADVWALPRRSRRRHRDSLVFNARGARHSSRLE